MFKMYIGKIKFTEILPKSYTHVYREKRHLNKCINSANKIIFYLKW